MLIQFEKKLFKCESQIELGAVRKEKKLKRPFKKGKIQKREELLCWNRSQVAELVEGSRISQQLLVQTQPWSNSNLFHCWDINQNIKGV